MNLAAAGLTLGDIDLGGIDAESDHNLKRYFVTTPYVAAALSGRRTLFLGRKGSGKSALFTQLDVLAAADTQQPPLVVLLTPDQYAWAALKAYEEQGILPEQAHTNAWKLTLAIEVAAALVSSRANIGDPPREVASALDVLERFLRDNYGAPLPGLRETATSLVKGLRQFNLSAFGFGVGIQRDTPGTHVITPAVVGALYDVLSIVLAHRHVLVALDRLDDSWDGHEQSRSLLVGLLKAAKELNDRYALTDESLRILVFLRTDIYDSLDFDDKDKHRPTEQHIVWTAELLKELIDRRLPDKVGVDELFEPGDMRGSIAPFNYIVKRTFLRPREVLQFLSECIHQAGSAKTEIAKDDIRDAEERYSGWKVADLKREYAKVFPDFGDLLECLRQEIHRYDAIADLEAVIVAKAARLVENHGTRQLMERLFDSSVIGVRIGDSGSARFKSEDGDLVLPSAGAVYVHQSLYRGLKIRETRRAAAGGITGKGESTHKVTIELLSRMMKALPIQDLAFLGVNPTQVVVVQNETFDACAAALGRELDVRARLASGSPLAGPNLFTEARYDMDSKHYAQLRADMLDTLESHGLSVTEYAEEAES